MASGKTLLPVPRSGKDQGRHQVEGICDAMEQNRRDKCTCPNIQPTENQAGKEDHKGRHILSNGKVGSGKAGCRDYYGRPLDAATPDMLG